MSFTAEDAARIGGSDLAAILGLSPYGTPLTVYARIVGGTQSEDSAPKKRGRHLEQAVLGLYAETTGAEVLGSPKLIHPRLPYGRASLDAVANRDGRRVVEVKTAGMSEVRQWGEVGTDEIPQGYLFQVAWYAGVALATGAADVAQVDVAALVAGDLRVYHVGFDPELFAMLEEAVRRFWTDYVVPRRPPPITEPLKDVDAVSTLYPRHDGEARRWESLATPEQVAVREWLLAREERKAAQEREAAWEARAKLALGTAPQLVGLPDDLSAHRIDWKQSKPRQEIDWKAVAGCLSDLNDKVVRVVIEEHTTTKEGARPFVARERRK